MELDLDGFFRISCELDGVYIIVQPPLGKGKKVNKEEVELELHNLQIKDIDMKELEEALEKADSKPHKIASPQQIEKKKKLTVEISDDGLRAYITLLDRNLSEEEIKDILFNENRVVLGVKEDKIKEAVENGKLFTPILVAEGIPPVDGEDAKIEYKFDRRRSHITLKELPNGRVDYRELNLISSVKSNEILAIKKPATEGVPGLSVRGEKITAKPGKDFPLIGGKNTELSHDGLILYSKVDGEVIFKDNCLSVEPQLRIEGDVDFHIGNIDFPGSVYIKGSVRDGFKVRGDSVNICGSVEKAYVISERDIIIEEGIAGHMEGYLKAKGNIVTKFIDTAYVDAGGDVIVAHSIRHSQVNAKKRIIVWGSIGVIQGGCLRAGEEINAKVIGSSAEVETRVEVGASPFARAQLHQVSDRLKAAKEKLSKIEKELAYLQNKPEDERYKFFSSQAYQLNKEIESLSYHIPTLKSSLFSQHYARIAVYDTIYPGVIITIFNSTMPIKEIYRHSTFSLQEGAITLSPYAEPKGIKIIKEKELPKKRLPPLISYEEEEKAKEEIARVEIVSFNRGIPAYKIKKNNYILVKIIEVPKFLEKLRGKRSYAKIERIEESFEKDKVKLVYKLRKNLIGESIIERNLRLKVTPYPYGKLFFYLGCGLAIGLVFVIIYFLI